MHTKDKVWIPKPVEAMDAYSVHMDKTIIQDAISVAGYPINPSPQWPQPSGYAPKVSQWLSKQITTPCPTPVTSTMHAIACAATARSTMPLGTEAYLLPDHGSSKTSHRTRSYRKSQQTAVTEAILKLAVD